MDRGLTAPCTAASLTAARRAQGNCTALPPAYDPPLATAPLSPLRPLQCMLVTNRTAFYIWQPGNVWLHNVVVHSEPPRDKRIVRVVAVVRARNLTAEDAAVPTQFFMTASALRGGGHLAVGLSVFDEARVLLDGAPR